MSESLGQRGARQEEGRQKEREREGYGLLFVVSEELEEGISGAVGVGEVRDEDVETVAAHFRAHHLHRRADAIGNAQLFVMFVLFLSTSLVFR